MCLGTGVGRRPVLPAGQGPTDPALGQQTSGSGVHEGAKTSDSPADRPIVDAFARERWVGMFAGGAGMDAAPPGGGRADRGPRSRTTAPTRSPDSTSTSATTMQEAWRSRTSPQAAYWYRAPEAGQGQVPASAAASDGSRSSGRRSAVSAVVATDGRPAALPLAGAPPSTVMTFCVSIFMGSHTGGCG